MSRPLRLRIPPRCAFCGAEGVVVPETTIKGAAVYLAWCCRKCNRDWPITTAAQEERRAAGSDRRRVPRNDRRRDPS